ncbi:hypothetical protein PR202_ga20480 [Eleusine coracana subsp. coracana]|uniref:Uncharacterized protein n=1 Tax=Eleusine coracana subsp. coracana TaxID=191504 RepID=A0AAV5CYK1_ELECO|nr:hypothetical protein PR202_ga20480 [Eleusine coracana subsp. coracana]
MRQRGQHVSSVLASLRMLSANSGHLFVGGLAKALTSLEESMMEKMQSTIEATIEHCKSSMFCFEQEDENGRRAAIGGSDAIIRPNCQFVIGQVHRLGIGGLL